MAGRTPAREGLRRAAGWAIILVIMNRRNFLAVLGVGAAGAALRPSLATAAEAAAPEAGFAVPPYAQLIGPDAVEIRWRTATPATATLFWTQDAALPRERWARSVRAEDGMVCANEVAHRIRLEGIDPAKPLRFEAVSEPLTRFGAYDIRRGAAFGSGEIALRPLLGEGGALTFAVFNDLHGQAARHLPHFLALPEVAAAKPAFALFNGDCADDCATQAGLEKRFLNALPPLTRAGLPALFLRGNHEYRGAMARRIRDNLAPLANGHYYGAFDLGPLRFLFLDSGEDKPDDSKVYGGLLATDAYLQEQADWLRREIATPEWKAAKRRVAFWHIPPNRGDAQEDAWHGPTRMRTVISPILKGAGLDVAVCAHTHHHDLRPVEEAYPYPTLIGGGPRDNEATVILVRATADALTLTAYDREGRQVHQVKA